jgi:hypothetical protein
MTSAHSVIKFKLHIFQFLYTNKEHEKVTETHLLKLTSLKDTYYFFIKKLQLMCNIYY